MQRLKLRRAILRMHGIYVYKMGRVVHCPYCLEYLNPLKCGQIHEVFVKRSAVRVVDQDAIMVPQNCLVMHADCHMGHGQDPIVAVQALMVMKSREAVAEWLAELKEALPYVRTPVVIGEGSIVDEWFGQRGTEAVNQEIWRDNNRADC